MKPSILEMIQSSLNEGETVHSVTVTGKEGSTLYVLVVRTAEYEGDIILKERFMNVDLEAGEATWSKQGINRRITGSFEHYATAMVRQYARVQQVAKSGETPDKPLLIDARGEGDAAARTQLSGPYDRKPESDADRQQREQSPMGYDRRHESRAADLADRGDEATSVSANRSTEPKGGVQPSYVVCEECEQKARRVDCVNIGGALGTDVWVHKNECDSYQNGGEQ